MNKIEVEFKSNGRISKMTRKELESVPLGIYKLRSIPEGVELPIRLLRANKGISSKEVGQSVARSESMILQYERGEYTVPEKSRKAIASKLGVSVKNIDFSKLGNALYAGTENSIKKAKEEIEMEIEKDIDYKKLYMELSKKYSDLVGKFIDVGITHEERSRYQEDAIRSARYIEQERADVELESLKAYYENKKIVKIARKLGLWKD